MSTWPQHNSLQLVTVCLIQFEILKAIDFAELLFIIPQEDPDFEPTFYEDTNPKPIAVDMEPGTCARGGRCTPVDV